MRVLKAYVAFGYEVVQGISLLEMRNGCAAGPVIHRCLCIDIYIVIHLDSKLTDQYYLRPQKLPTCRWATKPRMSK